MPISAFSMQDSTWSPFQPPSPRTRYARMHESSNVYACLALKPLPTPITLDLVFFLPSASLILKLLSSAGTVITSIALEIEHLTGEINDCEAILETCAEELTATTCEVPSHFGNPALKTAEVCVCVRVCASILVWVRGWLCSMSACARVSGW